MGTMLSLNRKSVEGLMIILWLIKMSYSSSYEFIYFLIALLGMYALQQNGAKKYTITGWQKGVAVIFSVLFSLASILSNYDLFLGRISQYPWFQICVVIPVLFYGGICVAGNIAVWCFCALSEQDRLKLERCSGRRPVLLFIGVFFTIVAVDFLFLFGSEYPGDATLDSLWQIEQALTGEYNNHHPYWHTIIIQFWLNVGYKLFGNYNDGVALYSIWQILFIATCFSYSVITLYQARFPKVVVFSVWAIYVFMPYHIAYSFTMWKDVVFGAAALALTVSFYRILKKIGKYPAINYIVYLFGGIGVGVWRTNGWLALAGAFVICFFFLKKEHKLLLLFWGISLFVSWWMRGPALEHLNIPQPDLVESLSIPIQQVARVIYEGKELEAYQIGLLDTVVDIGEIPDLYRSWISDPIKDELRSKDSVYFETHIIEYLKLWIKVGLRYPMIYLKAWIDQTKGYWNGGYGYWVMGSGIYRNDFGIYKVIPEYQFLRKLLYDFSGLPEFHIIFSIGIHVWLVAFMALINLLRKKKELLLTIPILLVICTLLIATPVYSEFRYAYSVFTTFPLIVAVTLWDSDSQLDLAK